MKYTAPYGNRASIMTSDIEIRVFCKEQFHGAIAWLIDNNFAFSWWVSHEGTGPATYHLHVEEMSWANNLVEFAQVLQKSDYADE